MVDTGDLKSPDLKSRAGSSPALGTRIEARKASFFFMVDSAPLSML